jgi:hypothetical protein
MRLLQSFYSFAMTGFLPPYRRGVVPILILRPTNRVGVDTIDALGTQNAPSKCNHVGNINPEGTVATTTQHTVFPDEIFHLFQLGPVHLPPFLVEFAEGMNHLVRRHVLRILVITNKKKTAFRTEGAACTCGKAEFHPALLLSQH